MNEPSAEALPEVAWFHAKLAEHGFDVVQAESGEAALEALRSDIAAQHETATAGLRAQLAAAQTHVTDAFALATELGQSDNDSKPPVVFIRERLAAALEEIERKNGYLDADQKILLDLRAQLAAA